MAFLKNFLDKLSALGKRKFIQDTAVLQAGSFLSTGLSFLASIIYARVLGVSGYASYALIFAFVSLAGIFMNVGTNETAVTLMAEAYAAKDREKIKNILTYYIKITLLFSILVGLAIIIIAPMLTGKFYQSEEIGRLARVVLLANIIKIFFYFYTVVLQVARRIKRLTVLENADKILQMLLPVGLVLGGFGLRGLIYGYFASYAVFSVYSFFQYRKLRLQDELLPSWREIFAHFNKVKINYYFKFGFLIAIDKNLGTLYGTLPIFILGIFSFEQVAFFKIATAYAALPLIFISPVSRLLLVQLPKSKACSLKILKNHFVKSSFGGMMISLAGAVVLMFLAKFLVLLVYGQDYFSAIGLARVLLIGAVFIGLAVGSSSMFRSLHLMKQSIQVNLILIALGATVIFFFIKNFPIGIAIYPIAFWLPAAVLVSFFYLLFKVDGMVKKENS